VREAAEGDDADVINEKIQELTAAVMKMGEAIYANASPEDADATADASNDDDEDIVDAEFEDVDDDEKSA